jgi:hypothetical protein
VFRGQRDQSTHCTIKKMVCGTDNPEVLLDKARIDEISGNPAFSLV